MIARPLLSLLVLSLAMLLNAAAASAQGGWLGLDVADAASSPAAPAQGGQVTVIAVARGGPAERAGIRVGDGLITFNGALAQSARWLEQEIAQLPAGTVVSLVVLRGRQALTPSIQLARAPGASVAEPAAQPILRFEAGGHAGRIKGIAFLRRQLITAGDDKVMRTWNWRTGELQAAWHGQIGQGNDGQIYALALSPDQKLVATGGFMFLPQDPKARTAAKGYVRLLHPATGEIVRILIGHGDSVNALAFSRSGRLLASGSADSSIIVWSPSSGKRIWSLAGHASSVESVAFTADEKLLLSRAKDGSVLVWDMTTGKPSRALDLSRRKFLALAIAESSSVVAVAEIDGGITILDVKTAKPLRVLPPPGPSVGHMSLSPDGRRLLVACTVGCGKDVAVRVLDTATGRQISAFEGHNSIVLAAAISQDGKLVATGGSHERVVSIWELETGRPMQNAGAPVVLKGTGQPVFAVGVSPDGSRIGWGFVDRGSHNASDEPLQFAMTLPNAKLGLDGPYRLFDDEPMIKARVDWEGLSIKAVAGGLVERRYGSLRVVDRQSATSAIQRGPTDGYEHTAYTVTHNGAAIVSAGRNGYIAKYRRNGETELMFDGHEDVVWSVATTPDDRFLVTGGSDQTVRLWSLATGRLIVSMLHTSDNEWVMWTPQGFYAGSPRGGSMVGWQINRGPDRRAEYITSDQYRQVLNRRDIIERAIVLGSAEAAIEEAFPGGFSLQAMLSSRPPRVQIATHETAATASGGSAVVTAFIAADQFSLHNVTAFVNGNRAVPRPVAVPRTHQRPPPGWLVYAYEVALFEGGNDVELVAHNQAGASARGMARVQIEHTGEGYLDKRGTLHILAIGVDRYDGLGRTCGLDKNGSCDLEFAGTDARRAAQNLERAMGRAHRAVQTRVLADASDADGKPSRQSILTALDALAEAGQNDTVALFLAGHGVRGASDGRYYFLPMDARRDPNLDLSQSENAIEWSQIQRRLLAASGRRLVFVDTCRAGGFDTLRAHNSRLLEDARVEQFAAYAASGPNQNAEEHQAERQGLFTLALVEGLTGRSGAPQREVRAYGLGSYLSQRVRQLSSGRQVPEFYSGIGDFLINQIQ